MSRDLYARYRLEATLRTCEPLHIGGFGDSFVSDMPLWRDGCMRLSLPGSSLAGAIRHRLERESAAALDDAEAVFGDWLPTSEESDARASSAFVEDAPCLDDVDVELAHHVRIDRATGAAIDRGKFDTEIVPRGCRFTFSMTIESTCKGHDDICRRVLANICGLLEDGDLLLGAASTRGQGRVQADAGARVGVEMWNTPDAVRRVLDVGADWTPMSEWRTQNMAKTGTDIDRVVVTIDWTPDGPVMSKAPEPGLLVDALPLTSAIGGGDCALMLQGSSIKGVLRSRAERIVRTVLGTPRSTPNGRDERSTESLDLPLVGLLFGQVRAADKDDTDSDRADAKRPSGWRGNLRARTCYSQWRMPADKWREHVADAPDAPAPPGGGPRDPQASRDMLAAIGGAHANLATHVAIDRWTGGAADALLFNILEMRNVEWEPLRLDIEMRSPDGEVPGVAAADIDAVWMLLLHLLTDVRKGAVTLGYGANRGFGGLRVDAIRFSGVAREGSVAESLLYAGNLDTWLCNAAFEPDRAALLRHWTDWRERALRCAQGDSA